METPESNNQQSSTSEEMNQTGPVENTGLVKQLLQDGYSVLTEPTTFFKTRYEKASFNQSLALGLAATWIAAFLDWVTRSIKHESLMDSFHRIKSQLKSLPIWKDLPDDIWAQGDQASQNFLPTWGMEGLKMLLTPFNSIFLIFINALIFWAAALILVDKNNPARKSVTLNELIKITAIAYTSALVGSIFGFLPLSLGSMIGWVYHIALLVIGFSIRFNISRLRGLVMVFLPTIALIMIAGCFIGFLFAIVGAIVSSLFHS
jgi:hypothetical protein